MKNYIDARACVCVFEIDTLEGRLQQEVAPRHGSERKCSYVKRVWVKYRNIGNYETKEGVLGSIKSNICESKKFVCDSKYSFWNLNFLKTYLNLEFVKDHDEK